MAAHRIMHVAHAFPPTFGGVETHVWDLSQQLVKRGYRIHCLVGGDPSEECFGQVTVTRYPELSVRHLVHSRSNTKQNVLNEKLLESLSAIISKTVLNFSPDLIHLHNAHHFAPELAQAFFQQCSAMPLLNSVHDRVGEHLYPYVLEFPWRHTIFASHYLFRSLPQCSGEKSVLWLGIDLSLFTPAGDKDERFFNLEKPVIFHPARLLRWKGVEIGLEAFITLRELLGKGSLVMCGSPNIVDDPKALKELRGQLEMTAQKAGVAEHVHFFDFERHKMPAAYRASDLIWYPTIDEEPLGLVPLEAMACGIPLIVTNSGGMIETVIAGETGLIVPSNESLALANSAHLILSNHELRNRLIEAGKKRAHSFDIVTYTTAIENIYSLSLNGAYDG